MKFRLLKANAETQKESNRPLESSNYDKLVEIAGKLDWNVSLSGNDIELENYSPAGEDLVFYIENNDHLGQQIFEFAETFDEDEHIEMWLEAKRNGTRSGVPSVRELVHDAEEIQNMLDELAKATKVIW